jgi:class 3 adenylate cyclase
LPDEGVARGRDVTIVSCDIVGHSLADTRSQLAHIVAINDIVGEVIAACGPNDTVWASGGDGGHVVFRQADGPARAVDLITRLRDWSSQARVPLRITAHVGPVIDVRGADGRVQLVGDGINLAGWILTRGSAEGIVASEAFRAAADRDLPAGLDIEFHDARILRDKGLAGQHLVLMSIGPDRSRWATPVESGRAELADALARGAGWEVLYFAKRILQTNTVDAQASQAIEQLRPYQLMYNAAGTGAPDEINPFFDYLEPSSIQEIAELGELVERRYNEKICRYGDEGDTMFVILRGDVGVQKPDDDQAERNAQPAFTLREGEIVGELAFALGRSRTADLIALSDVALLSFNYSDISAKLAALPHGRRAQDGVSRFMAGRALEYVCHGAPYLLGRERSGPLAEGEPSWEDTLRKLERDARLISVDSRKVDITFADIKPADDRSAGRGLYILVTGQLRGGVDDVKTLDSDSLPLVWADLPGVLAVPKLPYSVAAEPVKILYIGADGLTDLKLAKRKALYGALQRAAARCYHFDAFISYNSLDAAAAARWAEGLRQRGLEVYLDAPTTGDEFPQRLRTALLDSRAIIALVSPSVMVRETDQNWVLREANFHREHFLNPRIFPVCLPGGRHADLFPGFAPIDASHDEDEAINDAADKLRLRDAQEDPPRLKDDEEPALS